ncbi:sugar ABC transporter permease [Ruminococcus sp. HUN007]|uniref:carbohydrate ABC transporter permease n=1 Tax=Ruminococcus sp. HUN007 TaxID=1514668 RepID=UPI0005D1C9DA|nr:sugar ABC transporter permease [Ruminococcus sp. HUN007]
MKRDPGKDGLIRKQEREGFNFVLLWLAGFIILRVFPAVFSLVCSFSDSSFFGRAQEWGLMNYRKIFSDINTLSSFAVTLKYTLITVPLRLITAFAVAALLSHSIKGMAFFRTVFYIPSVLGSSVAVALLWKAIFRDDGTANALLSALGLPAVNWLSAKGSAMFVISLLRIWQFGSSMVVFLAALRSVPGELYEAAELDGAGRIRKFVSVTLPFVSPVIFFNLITQFGLAMQEFNAPFVITQGGPRGSTTLVSLLIYNTAFPMHDLGLSCALTWVFFIILTVMITAVFATQKLWVFYGDEEEL